MADQHFDLREENGRFSGSSNRGSKVASASCSSAPALVSCCLFVLVAIPTLNFAIIFNHLVNCIVFPRSLKIQIMIDSIAFPLTHTTTTYFQWQNYKILPYKHPPVTYNSSIKSMNIYTTKTTIELIGCFVYLTTSLFPKHNISFKTRVVQNVLTLINLLFQPFFLITNHAFRI